jgi:Flp pilus assembly protein TadD
MAEMRLRLEALFAAAALVLLPVAPASAARGAAPATVSGETVSQIRQAIDEQRLLDAARMLDAALIAGGRDSRLALLSGDLSLARGNYGLALASYTSAQDAPATRAAALQGQGIAFSLMGRSGEALTALQTAVVESPAAWRAWNALGSEYDRRGRWGEAEDAYAHALKTSPGEALVLNNRGYSHLLQHRRAEAVADLVAALERRPDFPEARTNLRLALAIGGDYDRAIAGGAPGDQAALLNNAGFAAGMRGDYAEAEDLLGRAIKAKSEFYGRAAENLKIVRALAARGSAPVNGAP